MAEVTVHNLTRRYGTQLALDGVSFHVRSGEFVTLLGPSGCGKSTTLNALSGLEQPTSGRITIGERCVFDSGQRIFVDARDRKLGLMFQSYALWPHMTVYRNLDFALELNNVRGKEAKSRIDEVLAMVAMDAYAHRYPGELSGGQQQRVALARSMVYRPTILLLDEPLSNLDAQLRERARLWLGDIQRRTGMTTVFVTHDQAEALSLSDRIIVMNGGRIVQIGTPQEIYRKPASAFVADFVGASNIFEGTVVERSSGRVRVRLEGGPEMSVGTEASAAVGAKLTMSVRPESLCFCDAVEHNAFPAQILSRSYLGARTMMEVRIGAQQLRVDVPVHVRGDSGYLKIPEGEVQVFA